MPQIGCASSGLRSTHHTVLPLSTQKMIEYCTKREDPGTMQLRELSCKIMNCRAAQGVHDVEFNVPFNILIANFSDGEKITIKNEIVGCAEIHPDTIIRSDIPMEEFLGIIENKNG